MSNFYQNINTNSFFGNLDNKNPQGQDANQMFGGQANNFMYMGMQGLNNQSKELYDMNPRTKLKKLNSNSQGFVPGGSQAFHPTQGIRPSSLQLGLGSGGGFISENNVQNVGEVYENSLYGNNVFQAKGANQKITQKGLANNSFDIKQGNSGAHQHSEFDLLAFDPNSSQGGKIDVDEAEKAYRFIINQKDPELKDEALKELNNRRDRIPNLAPILWYSVGTVSILLQELLSIYPFLAPPTLNQNQTDRTCNVLGLFQCIALNSNTRPLFLQANLHQYLYPLINTSSKQRPFEQLRVTSLGVIGALVKGEDSQAINFLMNTELIVLCLRIMKRGNELSRTVATFIVQKILLDTHGLDYVCQTGERLFAVAQILKDIIEDIAENEKDDQRLLRHIIRCQLRLSENPKAAAQLIRFVPKCIQNVNNNVITDDQVKKWHQKLLKNLKLVKVV